jgi:hypothetical protein
MRVTSNKPFEWTGCHRPLLRHPKLFACHSRAAFGIVQGKFANMSEPTKFSQDLPSLPHEREGGSMRVLMSLGRGEAWIASSRALTDA